MSTLAARCTVFLLFLLGSLSLPRISSAADTITTIGGNGTKSFSGDGNSAVLGTLANPVAVAVDTSGNIFIADRDNNRIRRIDAGNGNITTVAGNGTAAFGGDSGPAGSASLNLPNGVAVDSSGTLYIADTGNNRIRKVASNGTITTLAGDGMARFAGDGASATLASLNQPRGVAVDASGNVFIADTGNNRVRRIDGISSTISTVAGSGTAGFAGDNGAATAAQLNGPTGVAVDSSGVIYIADSLNNRIRAVSAAMNMTTLAGNNTAGLSGDGSAAANASLNAPTGVILDASKSVYIADTGNNRIRRVDVGGTINTIAGTTQGFSGDNGDATQAALSSPQGIAVDATSNYYIADAGNQRIRKAGAAVNPPVISNLTVTPNPVLANTPATFAVVASSPQNRTLTYSFDFGDTMNSLNGTAATLSHNYAFEGPYTATVSVSDGFQIAQQTIVVTVLGSNSGASGQSNISTQDNGNGMNPVDQLKISVPLSNGGGLTFKAESTLTTAARAAASFQYTIQDDTGKAQPPKNSSVSNLYKTAGMFVTTAQMLDSTGKPMGMVRKTVAISQRETGNPLAGVTTPKTRALIKQPMIKGKVALGTNTIASDTIQFSGLLELPGGMDTSKEQIFFIGLGNIVDKVTVSSKGVQSMQSQNNQITGLKVKYPSSSKKTPIIPPSLSATISFTMTGSQLIKAGLDTEGITPLNTKAKDKGGAPVNIQFLISIAGETYETPVSAMFQIKSSTTSNADFGTISGRAQK